jgi:SulP family sulfate permease
MVYRFSHSMYYANAQQFSEQVLELANGADPDIAWFCLDAAAIDDVDYSAAATLRSTHGVLKDKGIRLVLVMVSDEVRTELDRFGTTDLVGKDAFYTTGDDLIAAYNQRKQ